MKLLIEDFVSNETEGPDTDSGSQQGANTNRTDESLKRYTKEKFDSFYAMYKSAGEGEYLPNLSVDRLTKLVVIHEASPDDITACEQIWQQIELSGNFIGPKLKKQLAEMHSLVIENEELSVKPKQTLNVGQEFSSDADISDDESAMGEDPENESDEYDELDENDEMGGDDEFGENEEAEGLENDSDDEEDEPLFADEKEEGSDWGDEESRVSENESLKKEEVERGKKRLPLEDDFLKLDELEAFLDQEDAREEKLMKQLEGTARVDEDENDDDQLDYFTNLGNEGSKATYKDFFDSIDDAKPLKKKRKVTFEENEVQSAKIKKDLFVTDEEEEEAGTEDQLSMHEKRLAKYREKVEELEDINVAEKPWQLSGEVTAESRPGDSLLTELLTFDSSAQLPPEITAERTETMERKIMQRIKDRAFDDVVKKFKPKELPFEYKKRILLDQEKSSLSLAEVYEQEFLKQVRDEQNEEKNEKHEEIRALMKSVFKKLDMLSHFSLTPQAPSTEMKIVNNAPAVSLEEAVPVALADSGQLAPEEIRKVSIISF